MVNEAAETHFFTERFVFLAHRDHLSVQFIVSLHQGSASLGPTLLHLLHVHFMINSCLHLESVTVFL